MKLLRITHGKDDGKLLLTTQADIDKAREERRSYLLLRDEKGRFFCAQIQLMRSETSALAYEVKHGTGMISMRTLAISDVAEWDGKYECRRRDKKAQPYSDRIAGGLQWKDITAKCNQFFQDTGSNLPNWRGQIA